jgi:phage shock protein PspC (stress-responsive transcriptional regulator)
MENKPLRRAIDNRVISGVCGGTARYLGLDPTLVRIGWVLSAFFGGGLAAYMIAWFVIPDDMEQRSVVPVGLLLLVVGLPLLCMMCSIPFMAMSNQ